MTEDAKEAPPPEPKLTHYERRNDVMLGVYDSGRTAVYRACGSINAAKKLSRELQKKGAKVVANKECQNRALRVARVKVTTRARTPQKVTKSGLQMSAEDARALGAALYRRMTTVPQ